MTNWSEWEKRLPNSSVINDSAASYADDLMKNVSVSSPYQRL